MARWWQGVRMQLRVVVAVVTGWCYRLAARLHVATAAARQEVLHQARTLPQTPPVVSAGSADARPVRVLLLGNGPAESPGVVSGAAGFPSYLAQSLAARVGRRVEVSTILGGAWDLAALDSRLRQEQLHRHDALVVTAAYRPQLAEISLDRWRAYTERLRAVLVDAAGPEAVIRVLGLPWREAARAAPLHWGGLFGNRIIVMADAAEATLTPDQRAVPLRLLGPVTAKEWVGPAFSAQTYLRWANQVAAELAEAWSL